MRNWLRDGSIILGISLALFVGIEGFLRAFFPQHLVGTAIVPGPFSERDEVLGTRYVPNAHWRFTHPEFTVEYAINRHGFRDKRDHPIPKPKGRTRVLVLGDSFTFGEAVNYEDVWTVMAERSLDRAGRDDIELVKVGLQGADQRSQLILLEQLLHSTESDIVVIVFLISDLYSNVPYTGIRDRAASELDDGIGPLHLETQADTAWDEMRDRVYTTGGFPRNLHVVTLAQRIVTHFDTGYNRLYLAAPGRGDYLQLPLGPEPQRQLEITERLFEQIAEYVRSEGKELLVVSIPQQFQVPYYHDSMEDEGIDVAFYDRYFAEVGERLGFGWLAFLDDFMEPEHDQRELFYRFDGHLTPAGNRIVAEAFLLDVLPAIDSLAAREPPAPQSPTRR